MAGTRPRAIRTENGLVPRIVHEIDQFYWYRDIQNRAEKRGTDTLSAVRFLLPHTQNEPSNYVVVVGNGFDIGEVYLVALNWGMSRLTGEHPQGKSGLWKVFSYIENRNFHTAGEVKPIIDGLPVKLGEIF